MLILFDQGTPVGIRDSLSGHVVKTAREQGWSTLLNGDLIREAEAAGFQVLLTTDKNLVYQQNLYLTKIAVVALGRSKWSLVRRGLQEIRDAIEAAQPGTILWSKFRSSSGDQRHLAQRSSDLAVMAHFNTKVHHSLHQKAIHPSLLTAWIPWQLPRLWDVNIEFSRTCH